MRNMKSDRGAVLNRERVEDAIEAMDHDIDGITAITFAWSDDRSMYNEQVEAIRDALWREYQWVSENVFPEMILPGRWAIGLILHPSGLCHLVDPQDKRLAVNAKYMGMDPDNVLLDPVDLRVALIHTLCCAFTRSGHYEGACGDLCDLAHRRVLDMESVMTKQQLYGASSEYIEFDHEHTFPMSTLIGAGWLCISPCP